MSLNLIFKKISYSIISRPFGDRLPPSRSLSSVRDFTDAEWIDECSECKCSICLGNRVIKKTFIRNGRLIIAAKPCDCESKM